MRIPCAQCGNAASPGDARFCVDCGAALVAPASAAVPSSAVPSSAPWVSPAGPSKKSGLKIGVAVLAVPLVGFAIFLIQRAGSNSLGSYAVGSWTCRDPNTGGTPAQIEIGPGSYTFTQRGDSITQGSWTYSGGVLTANPSGGRIGTNYTLSISGNPKDPEGARVEAGKKGHLSTSHIKALPGSDSVEWRSGTDSETTICDKIVHGD